MTFSICARTGLVQSPSPGCLHQLQSKGQQSGVCASLQPADGSLWGGWELARDLCQSENHSSFLLDFCLYSSCIVTTVVRSLTSSCSFQVYIEDSLGERIWVDSSHCKNFVDNIQTAFSTKMPPKSMLLQLQTDTGRSGGDISAGIVLYVCTYRFVQVWIQGHWIWLLIITTSCNIGR